MKKTFPITATERNAKVRAVLEAATRPMSPTLIAERIGEPWCCYPPYTAGSGMSSAITPVCKRIGAIQPARGLWALSK